jgi:UPF0176 protein
MKPIVVAALYKFFAFPDYRDWQDTLRARMDELGVRGTLLLADEGINGTISGRREAVDALVEELRLDQRLRDNLQYKESLSDEHPFLRAKVKLKREIVTLGVEGVDPACTVGTYLSPWQWNQVIREPDTLVVDTRNAYEYEVGSFRGAVNPNTSSFREFPDFVHQHLDPARHRKVAMFCTGGIRCEKATGYLLEQGFQEVYHLRGGVLQYLEEMPREDSLWEGECFVFDERVTVDHDLQPGEHEQCHACRRPVSEADRASPVFRRGVCCPHCYGDYTEAQRRRFAERRKQILLARRRGEQHLGVNPRRTPQHPE